METYAQRSIRHCLDMIAPFEASDNQLEKGQLQFYQFIVSIYQEMYKNPEGYMVFSAPYEEYIAKSKEKIKQMESVKNHTNDSRESTLRNTFQQAIQFYAIYFYNLGVECTGIDEHSGALIISKEAYGRVLDKMNRIHDSKHNDKRYEILLALGIRVYDKNDLIYINHESYSSAMSGLQYLCKAPDSKYKLMNYLRLDYKNAYSPIPSVDDIKNTLPTKNAEIVTKLFAEATLSLSQHIKTLFMPSLSHSSRAKATIFVPKPFLRSLGLIPYPICPSPIIRISFI